MFTAVVPREEEINKQCRCYSSAPQRLNIAKKPLVQRSSIVAVLNLFIVAFFVTASVRGQ
jgi:uncharacterized membrane protein YvbJ